MFLRAKPVIESLYEDTCTIYSGSQTKDEHGITSNTWTAVYTDIPCRLSFSSIQPNTRSDIVDTVSQTVKLFVSPDVDIPDGSRIEVKRMTGDVLTFGQSGLPAVYPTHKEIMLTPMEVFA